MGSWRRGAEAVAIVAAVALCVVVAGPGGAIEHLIRPVVTNDIDSVRRLGDLAVGIPMALLLVPGLAMWAWGPALRPSGTALTLVATAAVTIDVTVRGDLTLPAAALLVALWFVVSYQVATVRVPMARARRRLALWLSVPACVAPWVVQAGRVTIDQLGAEGADGAASGDAIHVLVLSVALAVLLLSPVVTVRAFAWAAFAAATGGICYAAASLAWASPLVALPRPLAVLAIATLVAYADTVRQLVAADAPHGAVASNTTDAAR